MKLFGATILVMTVHSFLMVVALFCLCDLLNSGCYNGYVTCVMALNKAQRVFKTATECGANTVNCSVVA